MRVDLVERWPWKEVLYFTSEEEEGGELVIEFWTERLYLRMSG